jgi:hypothetical protein
MWANNKYRRPQETSRRLPNGNIPEYACGPLKRERYVNDKIEEELVEFKQEIEEKYNKSRLNLTFRFPRPLLNKQQAPAPPINRSVKLQPMDFSNQKEKTTL